MPAHIEAAVQHLDGFGRVTRQQWYGPRGQSALENHFDMSYDYDDAGRIEHRRDDTYKKRGRLETVGYDNLDRVTDLQRSSAVGASDDYFQPLHQQWSLDTRGNWQRFCQDDDGKAGFDLVQSRSHTADDDIRTLTHTKGPTWAAVEQDGNIVRMLRPNDPDEQLEATYDAWNRLIHLKKDGQKFADYEYDGLGRRRIKRTYDCTTGQSAKWGGCWPLGLRRNRQSAFATPPQLLDSRMQGFATR